MGVSIRIKGQNLYLDIIQNRQHHWESLHIKLSSDPTERKEQMKQNYPKIGIRPTIDGRQGGIREGLEEKTMNLAKAVKELIESNLRNGDGSKVECIIRAQHEEIFDMMHRI